MYHELVLANVLHSMSGRMTASGQFSGRKLSTTYHCHCLHYPLGNIDWKSTVLFFWKSIVVIYVRRFCKLPSAVYRYITDRRTNVFLQKLMIAQLDKKFNFILSPVHCYAEYRCILININIAFSYDEELLVSIPPQSLQTAYCLPSANAYSTYMLLPSVSRGSLSPVQRHHLHCGDICRRYKY